jgi:hypothetical protein
MRKMLVSIVSVTMLVAVASSVAFAQTTPAPTPPSTQPAAPVQNVSPGQVPTVSNLKPFSAEADYMSLAGYLRYLMYQQTNQWVTYAEASRVVKQQGGQ